MRQGTGHWLVQRVTSVPLALLFIYFVTQAEFIVTSSRPVFLSWVQAPVNTAALWLFILCGFTHAKMGIEEIIIDYVPAPAVQKTALALNAAFFLVLGLAAAYAVWAINHKDF